MEWSNSPFRSGGSWPSTTGSFHGGAIASLADNALTFAGGTVLGVAVVTSEFKINFLRPALGDSLVARATVVHKGRRQASVPVRHLRVGTVAPRSCARSLRARSPSSRRRAPPTIEVVEETPRYRPRPLPPRIPPRPPIRVPSRYMTLTMKYWPSDSVRDSSMKLARIGDRDALILIQQIVGPQLDLGAVVKHAAH